MYIECSKDMKLNAKEFFKSIIFGRREKELHWRSHVKVKLSSFNRSNICKILLLFSVHIYHFMLNKLLCQIINTYLFK